MTGNSTSNSIKIREFKEGDQNGILSLLKLSFRSGALPEFFTQSQWNWKYLDTDESSRIFVVEDHGLIVGHYGFIPRMFSGLNRLVRTMVAVDAVIHPEYRQKGLFYDLSLFALNRLAADDIPLCIGFTASDRAPLVMPGHKKAGWFSPFKIPIMGKPLNTIAVSEAKFGKGIKSKLAAFALNVFLKTTYRWKKHSGPNTGIIELQEPTLEVANFCATISVEYLFIGLRDLNFLKWRFLNTPNRKYRFFIAKNNTKIVGFMVLRSLNYLGLNGLLIIDLLSHADDGTTRNLLLDKAMNLGSEMNVDILLCLANCNGTKKSLNTKGFMKTGEFYNFVIHKNTDRFSEAELTNPESWYLSWCDFDVL